MKTPTIKFTKMHSLGNDFMVIDTTHHSLDLNNFPIQQLSHRNTGIGFDQLLLIGTSKNADFSCRFFNADGSEAEQCGNGVRCVARYLHENNLIQKNTFQIETKAGIVDIAIQDYAHIQAVLGIPNIQSDIDLSLNKINYNLSILSLGNPHAILQVDSVNHFPVKEIGQQIATHAIFPHGTNVGFIEILTPQKIRLRTYERGVGETLSCGSNACAAVIAGIKKSLLKNEVMIELPLGQLNIKWQGEKHPVIMTGPAEKVFVGELKYSS